MRYHLATLGGSHARSRSHCVCLVDGPDRRLARPITARAPKQWRWSSECQTEFKQAGTEATFKEVDNKSVKTFHDRDLYPFIYDLKGVCVAHGARPVLIGKNLIDLKDQDGKYLIREMVSLAKGSGHGWIDYKWPNPLTNKIEDKSSYIEKLGDSYFVGVGSL